MSHSEPGSSLPRWRRVLDGFASLSIIVACSLVSWSILAGPGGIRFRAVSAPPPGSAATQQQESRRPPSPPLPEKPVSLAGAATRGSASAKLAIIEFSDFQCPYCLRFFTETLPRLNEAYVRNGEVLMAFRHLPLEGIHPVAVKAAEAAECAGREGKFWEMHGRLFQSGQTLAERSLYDHATAIGLNTLTFSKCIGGEQTAKVRADLDTAKKLGLTGTPSFLIGVLRPDSQVDVKSVLFGAQPFEAFSAELEKLKGSLTGNRVGRFPEVGSEVPKTRQVVQSSWRAG
jgi:protein-disulfide isomerase